MRCISPLTIKHLINGKWFHDFKPYVTVPCGQCYACRVNRTSQWTFRLMLELTEWKDASFITLTYDDEHLQSPSLVPDDLKNFWKRLRKAIYPDKIKYYACGEYGDENSRPHYHAIVYGLPYSLETRVLLTKVWPFCDPLRFLYDSKGVAPVTIDDIAYVAGYCQKKLTGELGKEEYEKNGLVPPFSRSSRYLGLSAFSKNLEQVRKYGCVFWNGSQMPIPRYFRDKFDIVLPRDDDYIRERAKFVYGDDFKEECMSYYRHLDFLGYLADEVAMKLLTSNEQRRLDHLASVRARKTLNNMRRYRDGKKGDEL